MVIFYFKTLAYWFLKMSAFSSYMYLTSPKNNHQIPTMKQLRHETHMALGGLVAQNPTPIPPSTVRLVYKPLQELVEKTTDITMKKMNRQLVKILGKDFVFGASKFKTKRKQLEVYDAGVEKLKELNHPYVLITDSKISVLTQSQFEALSRDVPTCNCCNQLMASRHGRFGEFFVCENKCFSQKSVSAQYWNSVKRVTEHKVA